MERDSTVIAMIIGKKGQGISPAKTDYLGYEEVASVIGSLSGCRERAAALLKAVTLACLDQSEGSELVDRDEGKGNDTAAVFRLVP